jgi:hypothetical protein
MKPRVVPDGTYPTMFRVEHAGRLSDMANFTWVSDAARSLADRAEKARSDAQRQAPVRQSKTTGTRGQAPGKLTSDRASRSVLNEGQHDDRAEATARAGV